MAMKVIVYSNFPEDLVAKDVTPKLEKFDVEVLRVVNVDRSAVAPSDDADAYVAMVEKMSSGQRDKVKAAAKNAGKPYYPLTRASSDWAKYFGAPRPQVIYEAPRSSAHVPQPRVIQLPPSSISAAAPPAPPVATAEDVETLRATLQNLKERQAEVQAEQQRLTRLLRNADEELRAQRAAVEKTRNERDQMTERCRTLNKTIEEKNVEIDRLKTAGDSRSNVELVEAATKYRELSEQYLELQTAWINIGKERDAWKQTAEHAKGAAEDLKELTERQTTELYRLREELKKLKAAPPPSRRGPDPRVVQEFFKVREAFKLLWESKAMKADEVLKQLFEWKGSE